MMRIPELVRKIKGTDAEACYQRHKQTYDRKKYLDTDSIIVAYPKCGRGWINDMLLHAFAFSVGIDPLDIRDHCDLAAKMEVHRKRTFSFTHDFDPHRRHYLEVTPREGSYEDQNIVFLMRDPRDVMVSWFYYKNYRLSRGETSGDSNIYQAFDDDVGGFEGILRFMESWRNVIARRSDIAVFRYEDFIVSPHDQLARLLDVLGLTPESPKIVDRAVAASSFDVMRRKEELGLFRDFMRKVDLNDDPKRYKTRNGKIGSFRVELTPEQIEDIERRFGARLRALGY